ncbi:hypothetical protein Tco_1046495 [Tanacetum coccineum]
MCRAKRGRREGKHKLVGYVMFLRVPIQEISPSNDNHKMASLDDDDDLGFLDNLALELRFYVMKVRLWLRPSMESKQIRSFWTMRKMLELDTELKHVEPPS